MSRFSVTLKNINDLVFVLRDFHTQFIIFAPDNASGFCSTVPEFCIKNEEFCIKNDEFCIKNDGFRIKNDDFGAVPLVLSATTRKTSLSLRNLPEIELWWGLRA